MKIYVLPHEKHHLVETGIKAARESSRRLSTSLDLLIEALIPEATPMNKGDLKGGHRYNVLDVSPTANAWRDGKLLLNHGELYELVYTYTEEGVLGATNAWGIPIFKGICPKMLLIEG